MSQGRIERILVVDDNEQNRMVAEGHLVSAGYAVTLASSGEEALQRFAEGTPDLVLLDVMMPPGIDGFETCRRLRAAPSGADVAIVFLTALNDLGSHQKAITSGADDFLTKPINRTELLMRVRSLLWVKRLKDELRQGYELIRSQRDALLQAQRQKEETISFVVHDLKNPLTIMMSNAMYIADAKEMNADVASAARDIHDASTSMHRMVMNLRDISRSEDGALVAEPTDVDVRALLTGVAERLERRAAARSQTVECDVPASVTVSGDRDLLTRVFENLVENALKYGPTRSRVRVEVEPAGDELEVRVRDEGPGIPEEHRHRVFEKYVQLEGEGRAAGRGLGLAFCRLAVEIHGGRIWVASNEPKGSVFTVRLPKAGLRRT